MTLCVAAIAQHAPHEMPYIVYAADFESEGETAKAEIGQKIILVGPDFQPVLIAGAFTRAYDLVSIIDGIAKPTAERLSWRGMLREAVKRFKFSLADSYVNAALGIDYGEFLSTGKQRFPEDVFREMIYQISRQDLDCSLIVCHFAGTVPEILRIREDGLVENCQNFAAIGSGCPIAESVLFQREQSSLETLGRTIYNVFEAMRMGVHAPGVGSTMKIMVARWNPKFKRVTRYGLTTEYYEFLYKRFKQYAPREIRDVEFTGGLDENEEVITTPGVTHTRTRVRRDTKGDK